MNNTLWPNGGIALQKLEMLSLCALIIFLPLFEAPKNIFVALFLFFWVAIRIRTGNWGGPWSQWDTTAVSLLLTGVGSIYFGLFPTEKGAAAIGDILSYTLVFMCVRRINLDETTIRTLFKLGLASTAATLAFGYWLHFQMHATDHLQLNSVGHVNHSAIYLGLSIVLSIALALNAKSKKEAMFYWAVTSLFCYSVLVMSARGTVVPLLMFGAALILLINKKPLRIITASSILTILLGSLLWLAPGILQKTEGGFSAADYSSKRIELANTAIVAAKESPIFGMGLNNFGKITAEKTREWSESAGAVFEPDHYFFSSHAHNLYFNTLAERGVLGLIPLIGLIFMLAFYLIKHRATSQHGALYNLLWMASFGALMMVAVGGLFNTTLHHEHGMLSMLIFGLWLNAASRITR